MIKILDYKDTTADEIFMRVADKVNVADTVSQIIADVRSRGDKALIEYGKKFDKANLTSLVVSQEEIDKAFQCADKKLVEVIKESAQNIEKFHRNQIRSGFIQNDCDGIVTGQKIMPLEKVGLYVPGGTAAYPSSVLMNCIPAKIAGVKEIYMTTPATGGEINPVILVAAKIAGVDKIFKTGGAQAVAALAYGTESIPKVDKIVGPGNAYVAEAKRQVFGTVAIDMIAGPSEILVVADSSCNPAFVAADLLSQAEHDKMASAVLVTDTESFAQAVSDELERQIPLLPRQEIARASIEDNGKIILVGSLSEAVAIANEIAPEHLELCVDEPFALMGMIESAGSVFLGRNAPEALGDYFAGPNHTLPTSGTARFSSPLSVDDFVKKSQFIYYSREALEKAKDHIVSFARVEGLDAHANSVAIRFGEEL